MPSVVGNPRRNRFSADSWAAGASRWDSALPRGRRAAIVMPTVSGMSTASAIQTTRTVQLGIQSGSETKPSTNAASLGMAMPSSRIGQAAAAPTSADSMVFSAGAVWPNRATTAQPKMAEVMRPSERVTSAINACSTAMCLVGSKIAAAIVRQAVAGAGVTRAGCRGATPGAARKWVEADGTMLSEAGEHLLGLISALRAGICVPCSAQMMERTREDALKATKLKATKQLILNGKALATHARCDICASWQPVTVLRRPAA